MRAILVAEPGGPEVLQWAHTPDPVAGAGEVLIDVAATAVNRADLLQRQGLYPPPPGASEILGLECSGRIAGHGPGVTAPPIGAPVTALLAGGGYAERVAVPVGQLMSVPEGIDLITAAGLPEVVCTVYSNLVMEAALTEGEWLLIHGGGSGIGTMAIQIARALGAHVAVTAGSTEKLEACAALGAEVLINYRDQDFEEVLEVATAGRGVDVILDNMGASYLQRNINVLARNGRLVIIGMQGGVKAEMNIATLLQRNGRIISTSLRGRPLDEKAAICAAVERTVWPWVHAGIVHPVIDRVVPLHDAARAHVALDHGDITGKIVMETGLATAE
jgi:putative PIG3 family NAD(P)H quinone oxidoreductase